MANSVESLTQQLVHRVTEPFGLAILTGLASSSFFFFGGVGLAVDGIIPATSTGSERAKKGLSDPVAMKLWEWMFYRAKVRFFPFPLFLSESLRFVTNLCFACSRFVSQKHYASASMLSGASYLVASAFRPDLRPLLYGASLLSFSITPYTLLTSKRLTPHARGTTRLMSFPTVMPTNNEMLKIAGDVSKPDAKIPDSGHIDKLFNDWRNCHSVRLYISAISWGLGTAALLLS